MIARHALTILAVADLTRSVQFYREAFGWPITVEVPVYVELALPDERRLGLYDRQAFAANTGLLPTPVAKDQITGTEIYLHCDPLQPAIDRLEALGARRLSAVSPRPWGDEAAYYADPDGNVVVVARPVSSKPEPDA